MKCSPMSFRRFLFRVNAESRWCQFVKRRLALLTLLLTAYELRYVRVGQPQITVGVGLLRYGLRFRRGNDAQRAQPLPPGENFLDKYRHEFVKSAS